MASETKTVKRDVVVMLLAAMVLIILGGAGAYLTVRLGIPRDEPLSAAILPLLYWLRSVCVIAGAACGQLLCGCLLGRYLDKKRLRQFVVGLVLITILMVVANRGFFDADQGLWIQSVGYLGAVTQHLLQLVAMVGVVLIGARLGRRQRRIVKETRTPSAAVAG